MQQTASLPARRGREFAINSAIMAFALLLAYAAVEAYISYAIDDGMQFDLEMWRYAREIKRQSANPAIGHEHTPNTRAHLMGADVVISSQGLRDRDYPLTPPPGRTRVMILGDSLAFGWGVPGDKTYSKRLEQKLLAAGHDVEVINTGVGNYNTEMQVAYFLERGAAFQPHHVVLNYFINDAEPTPRYRASVLAENSRAYVYFSSRVDAVMRMVGTGEKTDWRTYYASLYEAPSTGPARVAAAVERLAAYCKERGIKLMLANYPELREPANYPFPQVNEFISRVARENGLPYLDMLPAVRDLLPESLWVTRPDPHPSVAAHEVFANELFRVLQPQLPPAGPGPMARQGS